MGFLDRILGREEQEPQRDPLLPRPHRSQRSEDEIAVERYQYLLRTAPPETIEQVHAEAFGKLTEEQRELLFRQLGENANASERPANAEPDTLAKAATRAELRQPGTLTRSFGNPGQGAQGGIGFGGIVGGSILGTVAGYVIGSALVSSFLPPEAGATDAGAEGEPGTESGADGSGDAAGSDASADAAGGDGGGDFGGGFDGGGFGGDFGF
ncbi:MAG: hypothetical protein JWL94_1302 [Microbacteriaceae bacterium]|jgi:hypothetical protein|nr:hypothetical protein [Microbacteriaceae bacterium]HEV7956836.1 hypothetical protein [Marisediminicola sp.]